MTNNFLDKGINYTVLTDLGLTRENAKKMVGVVMPLVQLKLQEKVSDELGAETMVRLKKEADKQNADYLTSLRLIDAEYKKKTGVYVMEIMRQLINEHLKLMAKVIKKARQDEAKIKQSGKLEELEKLMNENKIDEAAKLLEGLDND